ncbi:MAG: glycosyltransferase [Desulfovibrionaceae bacterium]|nr:glycosyltransferase [Desulfovibrionaceae bacterium]
MQHEIDILYITFNRLSYTKETLPALVENAEAPFHLTIVDNGSTDGTVDYLKQFARSHCKILSAIRFLEFNTGISQPTNAFWKASKAEFLGKVDNDTLYPQGWLNRLLEAHLATKRLGVIGGFHFNTKYVDMENLARRVIDVEGVQLVPDAFIGGCCYLFRRSLQRQRGLLSVGKLKTHGWTEYQSEICRSGKINGYLWPLLQVEHFDDPLNKHNLAFSEHREISKISLAEKGIPLDRETQLAWYKKDAARVVSGISLKILLAQSRSTINK